MPEPTFHEPKSDQSLLRQSLGKARADWPVENGRSMSLAVEHVRKVECGERSRQSGQIRWKNDRCLYCTALQRRDNLYLSTKRTVGKDPSLDFTITVFLNQFLEFYCTNPQGMVDCRNHGKLDRTLLDIGPINGRPADHQEQRRGN